MWTLKRLTCILIKERQREIWQHMEKKIYSQSRARFSDNSHGAWSDTTLSMGRLVATGTWTSQESSPEAFRGLTLIQWCWFWTSGLLNCKRIKFYCFQPASLCSFVTAATGNSYSLKNDSLGCRYHLLIQWILREKTSSASISPSLKR